MRRALGVVLVAVACAATTSTSAPEAAMNYQAAAKKIAREEGVDWHLFKALVTQESGWQPHVVSPAGARGFTQLMPGTAASLGVNADDPLDNLRGGARYLKQQLRTFHGDVRKALAAYNAGPGAVQKYNGVPPYAETQHYVKTILANAGQVTGKVKRARKQGIRQAGTPAREDLTLQGIGGAERADAELAAVTSLLDGGDVLDFALAVKQAQALPGPETLNLGGARAAQPGQPARSDAPRRDKSAPAGLGGLHSLAAQVDQIARRTGNPVSSTVRSAAENAAVGGAEDSDHLEGDDRIARDIGGPRMQSAEQRAAVAERIARRYGHERDASGFTEFTIKTRKGKFRVQIIDAPHGTGPHVHVGFRKVG